MSRDVSYIPLCSLHIGLYIPSMNVNTYVARLLHEGHEHFIFMIREHYLLCNLDDHKN